MRLEREGIQEDVYGRAPFISLVCGNKSWIKQPQPAWRGSTCDVDYPKREPGKKPPTAFNRRQRKTSRDPLGKQERLPGAAGDPAGMNGCGSRWPLPTRLGKVTAGAGGLGRICCLRAVLKNGKMLQSTDTSCGRTTRVIRGHRAEPTQCLCCCHRPQPRRAQAQPLHPISPRGSGQAVGFGAAVPQAGAAARWQLCHNKKGTLRERLERTRL